MKNDLVYLKHIKDAIETINSYVVGADYESFCRDRKTVDAVVYQLAIIGEAANSLSQKFRDSHPEIPWRDMIDMRNVLIHEYFGVIVETVWKTVRKNLPELEEILDKILSR